MTRILLKILPKFWAGLIPWNKKNEARKNPRVSSNENLHNFKNLDDLSGIIFLRLIMSKKIPALGEEKFFRGVHIIALKNINEKNKTMELTQEQYAKVEKYLPK